MSVSELQRRLRIAERVLRCSANGRWNVWSALSGTFETPADLLAWLTREDDQ
jgi:hypothetical protein